MKNEYDLVILGGGTGGYVAAIRASQLGLDTAVVEHQELGGTCLHRGCIPSKALLQSAEKWRDLQSAKQFGLETGEIHFNFAKIQQRKDSIVHTLHQGVKSLLKKADIDIYHGYGRLLGPSIFSPIPGTVSVTNEQEKENTMLVGKNVLLATGSSPRSLPGVDFDGELILSSDDALELRQLPSSIIILGGGIIGIEWASLLIDYGVEVTVLEQVDAILPGEDKDVQQAMKKQLSKRGVSFKTGITLNPAQIHKEQNQVTLQLGEEKITAEKLLVSIGRTGNTEEIGLINTAVEVEEGFIKTNDFYQTKESHIYAIGDCIGGIQLAHAATKEGITAVEHMAGKHPEAIDPLMIPSCIYSYPEAAKIGLTEEAAASQGYNLKVGRIPLQAIGKAHINQETYGFMKIITNADTEDILGVHVVGNHATELISEASLAKTLDATAWEVSQTIHPHPSVAEIFGEAALAVEGENIHG